MTFYLGKLGAFVALPDPEVGMDRPVERVGGVHSLLGGGRVRDVFAVKRSWQMQWTALSVDEMGILEGFIYGAYGWGPFILIDPGQRNLLELNVSTGTDSASGNTAGFVPGTHATIFGTTGGANMTSAGGPWPSTGAYTLGVGIPTTVAAFEQLTTTTTPVPVLPNGSHTFSAYVSNHAPFGVYAQINWYNSSNTWFATSTGNIVNGGATARAIVTATAPSTAVKATFSITSGSANTSGSTQFLDVDGLQFEWYPSARSWVPGLAVPYVNVDTHSANRTINDYNNASMTLLEA